MEDTTEVKYGLIDVKRAVSENRKVYLSHVQFGRVWYKTQFGEAFYIPFEEIGSTLFPQVDKAVLYMRYMNSWNKSIPKEAA